MKNEIKTSPKALHLQRSQNQRCMVSSPLGERKGWVTRFTRSPKIRHCEGLRLEKKFLNGEQTERFIICCRWRLITFCQVRGWFYILDCEVLSLRSVTVKTTPHESLVWDIRYLDSTTAKCRDPNSLRLGVRALTQRFHQTLPRLNHVSGPYIT